jgi:hypothetical protein
MHVRDTTEHNNDNENKYLNKVLLLRYINNTNQTSFIPFSGHQICAKSIFDCKNWQTSA